MSTKYKGYMGRFLDIDLSTGKVGEYDVTDEMLEKYLGSKGLASKILYDTLPKGVDPLGEDNVFIVNTGPLVSSGAPCTSRFNVTTKSPLTGGILSCNCGGNFGMFLKRAGFDGLILRGKASKPTWVHVEDGEVELKDAKDLWGLTTEEAQEKLPKGTGKMVIGPAGENKVLYACIISQERALGRGGAGAVMGSKNIKALTAKGKQKVPVANPEKFKKDIKKWVDILKEHPSTGEMMPDYGTAVFINRCNETNMLPTHNFKRGSFDDADAVSGETLADTRLTGNFGCASCVIKCGRRVEVDGKDVKGPEYETLGLLGPNLENKDLDKILDWNYQADLVGVDTVSLGNVLGFAMELNENGLWDNGLEFGKVDNISGVIDDIAQRRGIGDDLADGVKRLSEKYGGKDYAMEVKGLELPAYEPRGAVGHALGYAISNRGGCHIGGGYMVYFEANGPLTMDPLTTRAKPQLTAMLQTTLDALSDSGSCQFTGFTAVPKEAIELNPHGTLYRLVAKSLELMGPMIEFILRFPRMLAVVPPIALMQHPRAITDLTGMKITLGKFLEIGLRTYLVERLFNTREGFTGADDTLPRRSTHQVQEGGTDATVSLNRMIRIYYRVRGLDANGAPKPDTLRKLGMRA